MNRQQLLKTLIQLSRMNQKQFAEKHGVRPEIVSKWVNGRKNIYLVTLEKIAISEGYKLEIDFKIIKL